ncbi:hypothetical protein MAM1_0030c02368 [Mucor ambiguus]|uniref:Kelch repeat protein n=1 Tax=Mucor ambiguus TaxID=91626 RepID=A0A0C9MLZ6_9FUNG|nr:hypothetical protein MAM1_0030c02368 [Mucor ambiguus]
MIHAQLIFWVMFLFTPSIFAQIPARARSCCGLMNGKIHCYGGDMYSTTTKHTPSSSMNVLDLTNKSGTLATDLQNMWQPVSYNINNVDLTSRTDPQCVILEDGKQMLINGGYDSVRSEKLANLNIAYNVDSNRWDALPEYTEPPYGKRQIYYGAATNIPGQGVAFFGGYEEHINASWSIPANGNISVMDFGNPPTSRFVGYSQVAMFQPNNQTTPWRTLVPLQDAWLHNELSAGIISFFDPASNEVYYLGGGYRKNNPTDATYIPRPFDYMTVVNVSNSRWRKLGPTGNVPVPNRYLVQTDMFSYSVAKFQMQMVLCLVQVCPENTNTWKRHVIAAPSATVLQRSRHSAVLVNNDTLFIMWGRDSNNAGVNSILILNVSNPDNIVLSNKYVDPNSPNASQDAQGNTQTNDDGSSSSTELSGDEHTDMSTGVKAGTAVACIVALILGAAFIIWFCLRNRKKKKAIKKQQGELTAQQHIQQEHEDAIPMEVDWDRIESKYTEIPRIYTLQNHTNGINGYTGSPTTLNMETLTNTTKPTSLHVVPPDAVEPQNPHVIESGSSDVQLSLHPMNRTIKPDRVVRSNKTDLL